MSWQKLVGSHPGTTAARDIIGFFFGLGLIQYHTYPVVAPLEEKAKPPFLWSIVVIAPYHSFRHASITYYGPQGRSTRVGSMRVCTYIGTN